MTRFSRMGLGRRKEEANATPWAKLKKQKTNISSLEKQCFEDVNSFEKSEKKERKEKLGINSESKTVRPSGANAEISTEELRQLDLSLMNVESLEKVKRMVCNMSREGKIGVRQASFLIRRWRMHHRKASYENSKKAAFDEISQVLDSNEQTLEEVKKLVNNYVAKKLISRHDAGKVIKKWKASEKRRIGRQIEKATKAYCYFCRRTGHQYSECPERDESMEIGICYKCGSLEHVSGRCPRKNVIGYPYAFCFVCRKQGHISRDCEQNMNGVYPDGGSCNVCGSRKHLRKDCPKLRNSKGLVEKKEALAVVGNSMTGGDEDIPMLEASALDKCKLQKSVTKVVHF